MYSLMTEALFAEGEPYDRSGRALNEDGDPISVWSALAVMPDSEWNDMAQDLFGVPGEILGIEPVIERIRETDTQSSLRPPFRVYVDADQYYFVRVHE